MCLLTNVGYGLPQNEYVSGTAVPDANTWALGSVRKASSAMQSRLGLTAKMMVRFLLILITLKLETYFFLSSCCFLCCSWVHFRLLLKNFVNYTDTKVSFPIITPSTSFLHFRGCSGSRDQLYRTQAAETTGESSSTSLCNSDARAGHDVSCNQERGSQY